ncbi:hypothetical protein DRP07_01100 [Archaeoglobales archaeon]|nr:MAG: hypothetical protein DRP07_01100 [Archaeoglobales archaeon]
MKKGWWGMDINKIKCEQLPSGEIGCWIKVYVPKRWIDFIEEYADYIGMKNPKEKEKYILIELQSSIRDFIFAVLDSMKSTDPQKRDYFVEKYGLHEDIKISSDKIYLPK